MKNNPEECHNESCGCGSEESSNEKGISENNLEPEDIHNHENHNHEEDCCDTTHDHEEDCCSSNHSHTQEEDCCSAAQNSEEEDSCSSGHESGGCCCEEGLLENIEDVEEISKTPLAILGIGGLIFVFGYYISTLSITLFQNIDTDILSQIIFLIVVIVVGNGIIRRGIASVIKKEVKIEFLMTIATIGAFILGDGGEGASLVLLFYLAEYLEEYCLDRSKRSIVNLIKLSPYKATVKRENKENNKVEEIEINVKDLAIGDIVVVKPGDKIPIDGIITQGITSVDQSSITGESLAVSKNVGDDVYASTINDEGYIEIKVTKTSDKTIFSKIVDLIKESEDKKAKVDLFIDKFAKYYTPLIVVLAILVAVVPYLVFGQSLEEWIYRALVLLVISCPCALAISTPVSMVSAITAGTKNGIIIKGGEYIEELAKIRAIMFDKTGTLTEGNLEINNITSVGNNEKNEVISIACSLEGKSKHPIAKAFNNYRNENNIAIEEVTDFESLAGKGLKGKINGKTFYVGKKELFDYNEKLENEIGALGLVTNKERNDNIENIKNIEDIENEGKNKVIIGNDTEILGYISLTDKIRENGASTIAELKQKSLETIMLTGDNSSTAKNVAEQLGLDNYYPNLLPEDKLNIVEEVSEKYEDVVMVGDGVNDSPSLARANVGIAMGMGGADIAVETADIVLMQDNISKVSFLIKLAKKTMGVVKQNIAVCIVIKGSLAVLGIMGYISLWEAVLFGDMGLTLAVVGNALRIGV